MSQLSTGRIFSETFNYGAIEIERAQIEWNRFELLSVTTGLYLTPFGIWNVDHGSPTRIMIQAPFVYTNHVGIFPERQLGIMLHGKLALESFGLSYALTFSNGRGPTNTLIDVDRDKAFGGRVVARGFGAWRWKAGLSFYSGRYTDTAEQLVLQPTFDITRTKTVKYHETAAGADFSLKTDSLTVQVEVLANWREYDDRYRPPVMAFDPPGEEALAPDRIAWGAYGLVGYLLPLETIRLRPYAVISWTDRDDNRNTDDLLGVASGINWRIDGAVVLKAEYQHWRWVNRAKGPQVLFEGTDPWHAVNLQMAMAF